MNTNKLIMFRQTWPWMDNISGFDPLFVEIERQWSGEVFNFWQTFQTGPLSLGERILNRFSSAAKGAGYHFPSNQWGHEKIAVKLLQCARKNPDAMILLSVADDQFGAVLSKAEESVRRRIVAFFHQPPSRMRMYFRHPERLSGLKALICLSQFHKEYLETITDTPVQYMRLGTRHECFTPAPEKTSPQPKIVMVGHWLRDLPTMTKACERIVAKFPEIEIDFVIPRKSRSDADHLQLARIPQVRWHADLSGAELAELYQKSWLLFLPMLDASANTAIVDCLASGLPVVSSAVGGLVDYVEPKHGILSEPGDVQAHADAVCQLCEDQALRTQMSRAAREFAVEKLDWPKLTRELMESLKKEN